MSPEELRLITTALRDIATTLSLIVIINALEKTVSQEERYLLCQSLSAMLNNMLSDQRPGRSQQQEQMFY
jgi:hypothetical protein